MEITKESLQEGKVAKRRAQFSSGIYFVDPHWMQYGVYCSLRNMWKTRKTELKQLIDKNMPSRKKFEEEIKHLTNSADHDTLAEMQMKRLKNLEKKRQKKLCAEMADEENLCRAFYRWEMLQNLAERRRMREEERLTKQFMHELEHMKRALLSNYNVSHFTMEEQQRLSTVTAFERRRLELKAITLERRKMAEELEIMKMEDQYSEALRVFDRMERQRRMLRAEFGDDDQDDDDTLGSYFKGKRVRVPKWLVLPKNWLNLSIGDQMAYVIRMEKWKIRQVALEKNAERDLRRLAVVEKRSLAEWQQFYDVMCHRLWTAELTFMNSQEEYDEANQQLSELIENIRRLTVYCQQKGEEELRVKSVLRKQEELARKRDREYDEAHNWLEDCSRRYRARSGLKRLMETHCLWVDADSINGFPQRFRTEELRKYLFEFYFEKIAFSIINRAEIIATERKLMQVQEFLSFNLHHLKQKSSALKDVWREYRREEFLRLKRSSLNLDTRLFPLHRRKLLEECFSSWVRFHLWNRGHREAFDMKYEVIKRQMEIDRQFKAQLTSAKTSDSKTGGVHKIAPTTLQKHKERPISCKNCHLFYLESMNHSMVCAYHSGKFAMECPRSCPNPGMTALCISHKRRRWTCCDTAQNKSVGCCRRYHMPSDSDPVYDKIMEKINERDSDLISNLDAKLSNARREDWPKQALETKRKQVFAIEDELASKRAIAVRFHDLKFV